MTRTCTVCGTEKPLSEFYKSGGKSVKRQSHWYRGDCRVCYRKKISQRWQDNRQEYLARIRELRFGLNSNEYKKMLAHQGGGCAICGTPPKYGKNLNVDHDHTTGVVRGLLCGNCNTAIGKLGDTAEGVMRAVRYLSKS